MATQKKATDPTEAALSAIEEALALSINGAQSAAQEHRDAPSRVVERHSAERTKSEIRPRPSTLAARIKTEEESASANDAAAADFEPSNGPAGRPANDDRREIGTILQALQARPSNRPYAFAFAGSLVWITGLGLIAANRLNWSGDALQATLLSAEALAFGFAVLVPTVAMFVLASLARRAQEMKVVAQSMTRVAIRLAEPEIGATDAVVGLSQAIRREVAAMGDGIERAVARASELETVVHAEIATLEHAYNQNEIRLRTLIDELTTQRESIVTHADRVRNAITGAHEGLTGELESAASRISTSVSEAGLRVAQTLGEKAEEISGTLARSGEQMVDQVSRRGGELIERLVTTNGDIAERLSVTAGQITESLDGKAREITESLSLTGSSVASEISGRGNEVKEALERTSRLIETNLEDGAERLAATIVETSRTVSETIETRTLGLTDTLKATGEAVAISIDSQGRAVVERLGGVGDEIGARIEIGGDRIADRISGTAERLEDIIAVRGARLAEDLENTTDRVAATLEAQVSGAREALEDGIRNASDLFSAKAEEASALFADRTANVTDVIERTGGRFDALVDGRLRSFEESFATRSAAFEATFSDRITTFETSLVERTGSLVSALDAGSSLLGDRLTRIETGVLARAEGVASSFEKVSADFGERIEYRFGEMENLFNTRGEAIEVGIARRTAEAAAFIDDRLAAFEDRSAKSALEIGNRIEGIFTKVDEGLAVRSRGLSESIAAFEDRSAKSALEIGNQIEGIFTKVDEGLAVRARGLSESIAASALDAAKSLGESAESVRIALDDRAALFEKTVVDRSADLVQQLTGQANVFTATIAERTGELAATLESGVARIETNVAGRLSDLVERVDNRSIAIVETLEARTTAVSSSLGARVEEIGALFDGRGNELVEQFRTQSEQIGTSLAAAGESVTREIAGVGEAVLRTLEGRSVSITGVLRERGRELVQTVDQAAETLRETLDERGSRATEQFASIAAELRERTEPLLVKVETLGLSLGAVVSNAGENLERLDTVLEGRVRALEHTLELVNRDTTAAGERLSAQAESLRISSGTALREASAIAERFDANISGLAAAADEQIRSITSLTNEQIRVMTETTGMISERFASHVSELSATSDEKLRRLNAVAGEQLRALNATAEAIGQLDRRIHDSATERDRALGRLMDEIARRGEEFDAMSRVHTSLVTESLSEAEARAREIGAVLSDAADTASNILDRQLESVRQAVLRERERIGSSIRQSYEEELARMNDALTLSSERFRSTAEELRDTTSSVSRELEETRVELRRTLVDLPRESHQAAAAVRGMIDDQLKALEEINAVAASGSGLAPLASAPRPMAPRAAARSAEPAPAPVPVPPPAPAYRPEPPVARPEPAAPTAEAKRGDERPLRPLLESFAPRRGNGRPETPAPETKNDAEALGGWLSDLLARASEEEATPAAAEPPATMELVTRLTADAARFVRHDALVAFWDRWTRGDRQPGLRATLTPEGEAKAEEFKNRYRRDAAFRGIVDAYLGKFDDLLREIGSGERGASLTRTIMSSNEGKVYGLLAYAADRIA